MLSRITKALRSPFYSRFCLGFKNLRPVSTLPLNVAQSAAPATVQRKPDSILIKQWWSQPAFDINKPLNVPIYSFQSGEYLGQNVELDQSIFNVPLRRDIVHNVYHWRMRLGKITTHTSKTKGEVAGSGKKPHPQKKTGRARQGTKRAPGRNKVCKKKGANAHSVKPRDFTFELPRKIRLQALKVMLSAKLAEGKLRIVDSEKIDAPKTKLVAQMLKQFDEKYHVLVVTGYKADSNFEIAHENIPRIDVAKPHNLNILKLLKCDKLVITKEGLEQLVQNLRDRTALRYQVGRDYNRELTPSEIQRENAFGVKRRTKEVPTYDPNQPLDLKFKILQDYLNEYEAQKNTQGQNPANEQKS